MNDLAILVSSCDKYEDTWLPFFKLFKLYWSDNQLEIYLVTDNKKYAHDGLNIICTQVNLTNKGMSWSESIIESLKLIPQNYILIIFDDLFIVEQVNSNVIFHAYDFIKSNKSIGTISLTGNGPIDCYDDLVDKYFLRVKPFSRYRTSMLPAIWDKKYLLSLLNKSENAWEFEIFGTIRSFSKNKEQYRISVIENDPIKTIQDTGITKGKWNKIVPTVMEEHGIVIDYQKRGFFESVSVIGNKIETIKKLIRNPFKFVYFTFLLQPISLVYGIFRRGVE